MPNNDNNPDYKDKTVGIRLKSSVYDEAIALGIDVPRVFREALVVAIEHKKYECLKYTEKPRHFNPKKLGVYDDRTMKFNPVEFVTDNVKTKEHKNGGRS